MIINLIVLALCALYWLWYHVKPFKRQIIRIMEKDNIKCVYICARRTPIYKLGSTSTSATGHQMISQKPQQ